MITALCLLIAFITASIITLYNLDEYETPNQIGFIFLMAFIFSPFILLFMVAYGILYVIGDIFKIIGEKINHE